MHVNPEGIKSGDIISTSTGLAKVGWLNEDEGYLVYAPLNEPGNTNYTTPVPIRSVRLIATPKDPRQLTFPFIQEMIEKAITDRDQEIIEAKKKQELFLAQKAEKKAASTTTRTKKTPMTNAEALKKIEDLSPEELKDLLERLK